MSLSKFSVKQGDSVEDIVKALNEEFSSQLEVDLRHLTELHLEYTCNALYGGGTEDYQKISTEFMRDGHLSYLLTPELQGAWDNITSAAWEKSFSERSLEQTRGGTSREIPDAWESTSTCPEELRLDFTNCLIDTIGSVRSLPEGKSNPLDARSANLVQLIRSWLIMSDLIDYCDRTNWRNEKGGKANFNVVMNSALYTSMDKDRARNALKTWDDQLANRSDLQKELNDWSSVMCDSGDALSNQASPAIEQNAMCTPELVNNFLKNCAMFLLDASTNDRDKGWLETIAGEVSTAFSELQLPIKPWTQHLSEAATERVKSATEKSSEHPTEGGSSAPGRQRENNRKKKDKLKRKKEKEKLERQKMAAMIPSETDPERTKGSQSASVRGESTLEGLPMSAGTPINLGNELSEDPSSDHHLLQTRPKTVQSESVASALDQTLQEDSAPRSSEQSGGALEEEKLSIGTDNIPTSAGEDTSIASRIETTKGESFGDQPGETFGVLTLKRDPNNPGTELTSPLTLEQPSASVTTGSYHEATIASEASWRLSLPSDVRFLATYNEHQKYLSEKRDEGTNPDPKAYWNIHDSYFPPVKDHISPRVKSDPWENNGTTQYTHIPEDWEGPPNSEKTGPFTCFRPNFFPYPEKQYVGNVPPEEFESQLNERREMERREFLLRDKGGTSDVSPSEELTEPGEQRSSWQPQDSLESGDGLSHNDQFSTIGSTGQIIGEVREVAGGTSTGDEPIPDTASSDFKSSSGTKRTSRRDVTAGASTSRDEQSTPEKQSKDARRRADQAAKREKKRTEKAERKSQRRG